MPKTLHALAMDAASKAHAPYSKLNVGAAIRTDDGKIYSGCNIENASYPEGWCAETTAIGHMVMGGGKAIAEIAVYCQQIEEIPPCGGCRQRIREFANPDTLIHLCNDEGIATTLTVDALLPRSFTL